MADHPRPSRCGSLQAHTDQFDRFAEEIDELIVLLERIRTQESNAALFRAPSTDPATVRAAAHLAQDGHDLPGTPVRAISTAIEDLRKQAIAARLAARDYRAADQAAIEDLHRIKEQLS